MHFETGLIYHVYNQGNNREEIFFERDHYRSFEEKMRKYLKPNAYILAYCLMPNHFHWLLSPKPTGTALHPISNNPNTLPVQQLCRAIGILLSSHSKYLNTRYGWSGSHFRKGTKAKTGMIKRLFDLPTHLHRKHNLSNLQYARICLDYIHQNPVNCTHPPGKTPRRMGVFLSRSLAGT
jgi:putative transposase